MLHIHPELHPDRLRGHIIGLSGPTASGKTALALRLAEGLDSVIINADSMQVYREIPILTAQPTPEEQATAPHQLFGIRSVAEDFSVGKWLPLATEAITHALERGKTPILVGGTGLYFYNLINGLSEIPHVSDEVRNTARTMLETQGLEALVEDLRQRDPATAAAIEITNPRRVLRAWEVLEATGIPLIEWQHHTAPPPFPAERYRLFFLAPERETLYARINQRFETMFHHGALEEAKTVRKMHLSPDLPAMKAHGLPELLAHLQGTMTLEYAIAQAQMNTRRYAKRQFTWWRGQMENVTWLDVS
ncbi:MAG: tRNA (adenosine(37)-N6)-dimethylallyltransferase MiaA [Hyphomicrobiales bacterium]|nr:tRNA (adenosine(37)-N6)-dimethylallyltransferase MiaA [Hyphomicrobiales bacterium]